ncbi:rho GTPase-activating protein 32 [Megalops cyprinoides]|uniref:rho GTPase-activating protein 32 n=1 Tax=Megalops cyprinoides TaxID=118141 RepID=UPI0018646A33|nr:rho GTPase-activating protein 32 [Megalops cyprinoides]
MEPHSGPPAAAEDSSALGLLGAAGTHDALDRGLRPYLHLEEDDLVPELPRSIHPRERPDWEETISAMARSAEIPELASEPPLRSCGSTASMKVKNVKKLSFTKGHFPKLAECAHFHYENVDFGTVQLALAEEQKEVTRNGQELKELVYLVQICCQGRSWIVKRSYEDFRVLDKHLHLCIYDRRFSQLPELPRFDSLKDQSETVSQMLMAYLSRLSAIADNKINCGPALTWMEIDNKGNHLLVHEESCINVPAIAAAHVIKRYIAQAGDELSFEVGDIVSVIDMPPKEDTTWWRGKHGFQVGFFPSECVELINDKVPQSVTNSVPKPDLEMDSVKQDNAWVPDPLNHYRLSSVSKKHGKLITFLRSFMKSRPTKQKLKQRGILRERVFGCDLGEHLLNSGHDVPQVLRSCTEFIEKHGVVDGMYRLSGIASNIQKLRHEFDSEQIPDLTKDVYIQDIHCVGSLCKLYFRELPNPLLTYQLYEKFSEAVSAATDEERLIKIHDVIQQLPPPHYRTLEFLMRHLSYLATFSYVTNMHSKNLAIVWAPNLLRSKQIESACFSGTAAFMEVRIQSVVVEFILNHVDVLFSPKLSSLIREGTGHGSLSRPKSLLISSPSTKLLTLEEAQARTQAQINSPVTADSKYIEVGEGPAALQGKFHTIIEFPTERKRPPGKVRKSPVGSWRSFFSLGKSSSMAKRKLQRNPSEPNEIKSMALAGGRGDTGTLRSAKSEESLSSLHNVEGEAKVYRPRRPRSSSDALSASFNGDLLDSRHHCNSYDNLPRGDSDGDEGHLRVPALISPPRSAEDVDLSPPDIGVASLDFDPMSFQFSLPATEPAFPSLEFEGSGSGSEPVSPSPERLDSPLPSPGTSPPLREADASSLSPTGPKSPTSPLLGISEPAEGPMATPFSENAASPPAAPPPLSPSAQPISAPQGTPEKPQTEGHQHVPQGEVSADPSTESRGPEPAPPTCSQSQPGAVFLDSPGAPAPMSSVSLLPPPPPPKNAARMLALALAESAQQASMLSQRRASGPPTPVSPLRPPELAGTPEWPTPPPFQPHTGPGGTTGRGEPPAPPTTTPAAEGQTPAARTRSPPAPCASQAIDLGPGGTSGATSDGASSTLQQASALQAPPIHESPERRQPAMGQVPVSSLKQGGAAVKEGMATIRQGGVILKEGGASIQSDTEVRETWRAPQLEEVRETWRAPQLEEVRETWRAPQLEELREIRRAPQPEEVREIRRAPQPDEVRETWRAPQLEEVREIRRAPQPDEVRETWRAPQLEEVREIRRAPQPEEVREIRRAPQPDAEVGMLPMSPPREVRSPPLSKPEHGVSVPHPRPGAPSARPIAVTPPHPAEQPWEAARPPPPRSEPLPPHHAYSATPTPPTPPVRSMESRLAAAALSGTEAANASNFHAILAGVSVPASVEEVLPQPAPPPRKSSAHQPPYPYHPKAEGVLESPGERPDPYYHPRAVPTGQSSMGYHYRPESVPPHLSWASKSDPQILYSARADTRYATLGPKSFHQSFKARGPPRGEFLPGGHMGHRAQGFILDGAVAYPTIRRVHSLHAPPTGVRAVPVSRAEVPPDDEPYPPRPFYPHKAYPPPPPAPSDYHVTQLQPYFENGRVQYRYSPYSGGHALDTPFYDVDPYGTVRLRHAHGHGHPHPGRSAPPPHPVRVGGRASGYPYLSRHAPAPPVGKENSFVSRDVPPAVYLAWDPEEPEAFYSHTVRREARARQKARGPVLSQYDNVGPLAPAADPAGPEIRHLRSKSDPGKAVLMAVAEGKDGRYGAAPLSQHAPRHPPPDPEVLLYVEQEKRYQGNGVDDKPPKQGGSRGGHPPLHQDLGRPDAKGELADHKQGAGGRHWQEPPDARCPPSRYERPDPDRHAAGRVKVSGGYHDDDPQAKHAAPPKPERQQGARERHHYTLSRAPPAHLQEGAERAERDHRGNHSFQPHGKWLLSHYDNLDDYHPIPQPPPQTAPGPGFTPQHTNRTYATALGQGAFVPAELPMQRPEAEIRAE